MAIVASLQCLQPALCPQQHCVNSAVCCGSAGHDRTCNDVGHLPLGEPGGGPITTRRVGGLEAP